ncbi:MAG: ABC transporter substrate-binding protein [Spirochaetaceae bacterium]|jgi:peptide/nickel transport system substrate-binding protein|nr:ABC transporter substrate-binding protein [Spirochaetaceae bacterium]
MILKKASVLAFILILAGIPAFAGGASQSGSSPAATTGTLPRNETLYYNGLVWGRVTQFNPYGQGGVSFALTGYNAMANNLIYETLFLYNMLDGKIYPHIGQSYAWNGPILTVKLNPNVRFNDGSKFTAADAVNSYILQRDYQTGGSGIWNYIESVTAKDDYTVEIKASTKNYNPKRVEESLAALYMTSKSAWDKILAQADPGKNNRMAVAQYANLENIVASGPYKPYFWDETKVVLIRDDNYWGKHPSRFGKLPPPKYICHNIFKDNAAGDAAFRVGEVDISHQFISQVWKMWESGAKVETYLPQAPYYFPGTTVCLIYNVKKPGLDDPAVRRALSISVDFNTVGQNAMSGYTPPVAASLMLPTQTEQALVDWDAVKPYQWTGTLEERAAEANRILDQAGWVKDADGIRAKGGVRLSFTAECPNAYSDWQATLEVVAQSARTVGIEVKTNYLAQPIWVQNRDNTQFDITLMFYSGAGPAAPWSRLNAAIGSTEIPAEGTPNSAQNYGRWINQEVNDILAQILKETDPAKIKALYTRLNIIYLQQVPIAVVMYRPILFFTVNTSNWEGYPKLGDGTNIPPTLCSHGYGIEALYRLKPRR